MFNWFKQDSKAVSKDVLSVIDIAFENLFVIDYVQNIPRIKVDGVPNKIQTVADYYHEYTCYLNYAHPSLEHKMRLHIFMEGFYVIELLPNDDEGRLFIVARPSEVPIDQRVGKDEFELLYRPLNGLRVAGLINLISEIRNHKDLYNKCLELVFIKCLKFFDTKLASKRIRKIVFENGEVAIQVTEN